MHSNVITPSKEKRCPKYRETGQDDRGLLVRKKKIKRETSSDFKRTKI